MQSTQITHSSPQSAPLFSGKLYFMLKNVPPQRVHTLEEDAQDTFTYLIRRTNHDGTTLLNLVVASENNDELAVFARKNQDVPQYPAPREAVHSFDHSIWKKLDKLV